MFYIVKSLSFLSVNLIVRVNRVNCVNLVNLIVRVNL